MTQTPLLFLGDSPSLNTGLGRIGRDLATHAASLPEFRVGFLGRGGIGSRKIPVAQYDFDESLGWGSERILSHVWDDFADNRSGIVCCIWDPSRLGWLSQGQWMSGRRGQVKLWLYCPVDAACVDGRLTQAERDVLMGFDRILAYGEFGAKVLENTLGVPIDWLPHGIDTNVFQPRERQAGRTAMGFKARDKVLGCVMTNQARKDWAVAIQTLQLLPGWKGWFHVDVDVRWWNLPELLRRQFGVEDRVKVTYTGQLEDVDLSYHYSACDVTILPSAEGFGFPLAESLACGTPAVHSTLGGGNWRIPGVTLMEPSGVRIEGAFNRVRPVFDAHGWAQAIADGVYRMSPEDCRSTIEYLGWDVLWEGRWKKWMLEGAC